MDWARFFTELWTYHKGKTVGVFTGLIFSLIVVIFGFFQAVFISLCIVIGYLVGGRIDDNVHFHDLMDRFFRNH